MHHHRASSCHYKERGRDLRAGEGKGRGDGHSRRSNSGRRPLRSSARSPGSSDGVEWSGHRRRATSPRRSSGLKGSKRRGPRFRRKRAQPRPATAEGRGNCASHGGKWHRFPPLRGRNAYLGCRGRLLTNILSLILLSAPSPATLVFIDFVER